MMVLSNLPSTTRRSHILPALEGDPLGLSFTCPACTETVLLVLSWGISYCVKLADVADMADTTEMAEMADIVL